MKKILVPFCCLLLGALILAGCQTRSKVPKQPTADSEPGYQRPSQDGEPWWDKDVSEIPDAVPTPHYGPYKAAPYRVLGKKYYPIQDASAYDETGLASWYGTKFHGKATANGELYDLYGMTAAHKTLPLPSYVQVTNLDNGLQVVLRVNDRGPFHGDRIIDLSFAAAKRLGFVDKGVARVRVQAIEPEQQQVLNSESQSATVVQAEQPSAAKPAGLFLQAGAFASADSAQRLRGQLAELTASEVFISPVNNSGQIMHRVRIGPIDTRQQAEELQQRLRETNLANPTLVYNSQTEPRLASD